MELPVRFEKAHDVMEIIRIYEGFCKRCMERKGWVVDQVNGDSMKHPPIRDDKAQTVRDFDEVLYYTDEL